jgi:hypothetical protein
LTSFAGWSPALPRPRARFRRAIRLRRRSLIPSGHPNPAPPVVTRPPRGGETLRRACTDSTFRLGRRLPPRAAAPVGGSSTGQLARRRRWLMSASRAMQLWQRPAPDDPRPPGVGRETCGVGNAPPRPTIAAVDGESWSRTSSDPFRTSARAGGRSGGAGCGTGELQFPALRRSNAKGATS